MKKVQEKGVFIVTKITGMGGESGLWWLLTAGMRLHHSEETELAGCGLQGHLGHECREATKRQIPKNSRTQLSGPG